MQEAVIGRKKYKKDEGLDIKFTRGLEVSIMTAVNTIYQWIQAKKKAPTTCYLEVTSFVVFELIYLPGSYNKVTFHISASGGFTISH